MTDTPQVLLAHCLRTLKLPTFLREYDKVARQCAAEGVDYPRYLLRLAELELIDRERRMIERRIKAAKFPTVKSLDSFDFAAFPSLNKALVMELARSECRTARERHRGRQQRHGQVSHRSGTRSCSLPERPVGRLHDRRRPRARADRSARREAPFTPAAPVRRLQAADHRRTRIRAAVADRRRVAVRGLQPTLRTGRHHRDQQSAVRRMDQRIRVRAVDRRPARPSDPSRPYPRNERRKLSARSEQATLETLPTRSIIRRADRKLTRPRETSSFATLNDSAHRGSRMMARCALSP